MPTRSRTPLQSIEALDEEHDLLARILGRCPACRLPLGDERKRRFECRHRDECGAAIRRTLSELVLASVAHFDHEVAVLRANVCREDFETHSREHVGLTEALTTILAEYTENRDCLDALERIQGFAKAISAHMAGTDTPMLRTRPPASYQ